MGVADREIGERHFEAECAHRHAEHVIVGKLVLDDGEAANGLESRATHRDGRANAGMGQFQGDAGDDIGQKAIIHAHGAEARPQAFFGNAAIEAGDESDVGRLQSRHQPGQVIGRNANIAVRQHQYRMLDMARQVDQVGDLAIGAVPRPIDDQCGGQPGWRAIELARAQRIDDFFCHRRRRVGGVMHAEQDLHRASIILAAEARQIFKQILFSPVERLEDGDAGGFRALAMAAGR